jgi:hypothetical protein
VLRLPILPPLRAILDASGMGQETWLATAFAKPYSVNGFGTSFTDWCKEAELPQCNCHGLHKTTAVRVAEARASEHELMAMFGWEDAGMARAYTRKAAQKKLAASGAAKLSHPLSCKKKKTTKSMRLRHRWCPGADLNHRHADFQSAALPTELPGHFPFKCLPGGERYILRAPIYMKFVWRCRERLNVFFRFAFGVRAAPAWMPGVNTRSTARPAAPAPWPANQTSRRRAYSLCRCA